MRNVYLVFFGTGSSWEPGIGSPEQAGFRAHADYLNEIDKQNRLVIGGPLEDYSNILLALEADSADQVRDALKADPWIVQGKLLIERIMQWTLLVDPR
jgi:uncharacterized protein YciI